MALDDPDVQIGGMPAPSSLGEHFRGVAIHWQELALPTSKRRRQVAPTVPVPTWRVQVIRFRSLTLDQADRAPESEVELQHYVRHAYAIAAVSHPIPSSATVYYEVGV